MGNSAHSKNGIECYVIEPYDTGIYIVDKLLNCILFMGINRYKNPIEACRMHEDIVAYGSYDNGFYKDVPWEMKRISMGGCDQHWCGYVLYNGYLTEDEMELIEEKADGELTSHLAYTVMITQILIRMEYTGITNMS